MKLVQMGRGSTMVMFNWIVGGSGYEPGAEDHGSPLLFTERFTLARIPPTVTW